MKNIYINYNLVFDYNSILFCALRSYLLPLGFNIQNSTRSLYELKSPQQAYNSIPNDSKNELCKPEDFLELFRKYFTSIKPTIAAIDTVMFLKDQGNKVTLYSNVEEQLMQKLIPLHENWLAKDEWELTSDASSVLENADVIIDGDEQLLKQLGQEKSNKTLIYLQNHDFHSSSRKEQLKQSELDGYFSFFKWEDIPWKEVISTANDIPKIDAEYFLKLKEAPKGNNILGYSGQIKLNEVVYCESKVIHGQGKAATQLGIPTANLEVNKAIEEKISCLLTGVYVGAAELFGNKYQALFFIGSSQYFNDSKKQLECYIYNEFAETFYDAEIKTEIHSFIRPEADFKCFDHLIKAIHCDHAKGQTIKLV